MLDRHASRLQLCLDRLVRVAFWILLGAFAANCIGCVPVPPLASVHPRIGSDHKPKQTDRSQQAAAAVTAIHIHPFVEVPLVVAGEPLTEEIDLAQWRAAPKRRPEPETYSVPASEAGDESTLSPDSAPSSGTVSNNSSPAPAAATIKSQPTLAPPHNGPPLLHNRFDEDKFWPPAAPGNTGTAAGSDAIVPPAPEPLPDPTPDEPTPAAVMPPRVEEPSTINPVAAGGSALATLLVFAAGLKREYLTNTAWPWLRIRVPQLAQRMRAMMARDKRTDASHEQT